MSLYKKSFEVKEAESALRGFTKKYTIEGQADYDPSTFFNEVKESVIKLFQSNLSTKVILSLKCHMERQDIKTGEVVFNLPYFHLGTEVNLRGTDVNDLYQKMTDKTLEGIAKHNKGGSNLIFKQILSLETHTVQYEPLGGSSYIKLRQFTKSKFTPIFSVTYLFIKNLGKTQGNLKCIPNNEERYISFSKYIKVYNYTDKETRDDVYINHEMRFLNSCKFMASSLVKLSSNLDKEQFTNLNSMYKGKQLELLKCKGVYPYDYVGSLDRLAEPQQPPKETYYSKLNDEHISDEDYEHTQKVWEAFDCKTLKDYHGLYLESDVFLLADVFETFRDLYMTNYELDPAWYVLYSSRPGLGCCSKNDQG